MLLKIREKSQGVFAWIILIVICVPFALWGIQNYIGGASAEAIVSVADKDFFQEDINKAYQQHSQNFAGMKIDEATLRQQATLKLIKDEVLLQHVRSEGLVTTDAEAKKIIQSLPYFQIEGKFDPKQYKALLNSQRISSAQFVNRIKQAQVMEHYQQSILATSFATNYDIDTFFKIQNQQRSLDYLIVNATPMSAPPSDESVQAYYQQHQDRYQTQEQVSIDYISLSLNDLAKKITVSNEQVNTFYHEQKELYTTKERRKISHILFAFGKDGNDEVILAKAQAAQKELASKSFAVLAAEISDDPLTAKKGGDLGLFEIGGLEKILEEAVSQLKQGEVSAPIKSNFGYHLLTVTDLVPAQIQTFESVKNKVTHALQRKEAETSFYETAERLAEVSYENSDNLTIAADTIGATIEKSQLFSKDKGEGIATEAAIRLAAFSEDVLAGNNSESIELGSEKIVVLRVSEHQPKSVRPLSEVKDQIMRHLLTEQARQHAEETAISLKKQLLNGKSMQTLATDHNLVMKNLIHLQRNNKKIPWQVNQAIFKAAKPLNNTPTLLNVALETGTQYIVALHKVTEGVMTDEDKKQLKLAKFNIAKVLGQSTFEAVLASLQAKTTIVIKK